MKLVVLGSGTSVPHPQRAALGFWLETEMGSLLLDCGADAARDFNSWELQAVQGARKLFTSAGFTTPSSDDEPTFLRKAVLFDLELKLDWIWLRGLSAQSYGIDRTTTVSDHFPPWTVVRLEKQSFIFR